MIMDNFDCTCYWWSSELKWREKIVIDNIVMWYRSIFMNEHYESVS